MTGPKCEWCEIRGEQPGVELREFDVPIQDYRHTVTLCRGCIPSFPGTAALSEDGETA